MNSEELREYFNSQLDLIRVKLDMKRSRGWKSELYNLTGVSSQSVSNAITDEDKSRLDSYLYDIIIKWAGLSPIELIERIEQEKSKELLRELEEVKRVNSRLLEELGREEHY